MEYTWNQNMDTVVANLKHIEDYNVRVQPNGNGLRFTIRRRHFYPAALARAPIHITGVGQLTSNHDQTTSCQFSYRYGASLGTILCFALLTFLILWVANVSYGIPMEGVLCGVLAVTALSWVVGCVLSRYSSLGQDEAERIAEIIQSANS